MKKITVIIGAKKFVGRVSIEDVSKIYYLKRKVTPKLPRYCEQDV